MDRPRVAEPPRRAVIVLALTLATAALLCWALIPWLITLAPAAYAGLLILAAALTGAWFGSVALFLVCLDLRIRRQVARHRAAGCAP